MLTRRTLLGAAATASIVSALPIRARAADVTLRLAHFAAESHPAHTASVEFAKKVAARTGGAVAIEIYPANELGSPPEQLEQTVLGAIDMNLPTHGALDKYNKAFGTVMTPFAFRDYEHAHRVLDGPFTKWAAPKIENDGLVMLSHWEYGFRNITNNIRPINAPKDVAGMKIRTPPEVQIVAAIEGLGANAVQIAFPELPNALNQGVVDGQENPIGVIYHSKLNEFQKHLALTRHVYNSMIHVVSKGSWDGLTPEQQTVIREESAAAGTLMRKLVQEQEQKEITDLQASGMKVTRPDLTPFAEKVGPAREHLAAISGEENMKTFLAFLQQ